MARKPRRRRTESGAHRESTLPRKQPREQQAADIGATNQEQESRSHGEDPGRSVKHPEQLVLQGTRNETIAAERFRIHLFESLGESCQICVGFRDGNARFKLSDSPKICADAIVRAGKSSHGVCKSERYPRVALFTEFLLIERIAKILCGHSDNGEGPLVQVNGAPEDVWRARELPLPESIAKHDDGIAAAETIFVFLKDAAGRGVTTE